MTSSFAEGDLSATNTEGPTFSMGHRSGKSSKKPKVSKSADIAPAPQPEHMQQMTFHPHMDDYSTVKLTDVLPLILCAGILALLYFMIREWHSDRENNETQMKSIGSRLDQLEKLLSSSPPKVLAPPAPSNTEAVPVKPDDDDDEEDDEVVEPSAGGTYELKGDTVSYNPPGSPAQKEQAIDSPDSENEEPVADSPGKVNLPKLQPINESDSDGEDGTFG